MVNLLARERGPSSRRDVVAEWPPQVRAVLPSRLRTVQQWWPTLDPAAAVAARARTPALEPDLEEESSLAALEAALIALDARRADRLAHARAPSAGPVSAPGRLLVCELDMSIGGGEAEAASRGLFDVDDRPPWDLWLVAWGRRVTSRPDEPIAALLAWIPEAWTPLAQAGLEACPSGVLYWIEGDAVPGLDVDGAAGSGHDAGADARTDAHTEADPGTPAGSRGPSGD